MPQRAPHRCYLATHSGLFGLAPQVLPGGGRQRFPASFRQRRPGTPCGESGARTSRSPPAMPLRGRFSDAASIGDGEQQVAQLLGDALGRVCSQGLVPLPASSSMTLSRTWPVPASPNPTRRPVAPAWPPGQAPAAPWAHRPARCCRVTHDALRSPHARAPSVPPSCGSVTRGLQPGHRQTHADAAARAYRESKSRRPRNRTNRAPAPSSSEIQFETADPPARRAAVADRCDQSRPQPRRLPRLCRGRWLRTSAHDPRDNPRGIPQAGHQLQQRGGRELGFLGRVHPLCITHRADLRALRPWPDLPPRTTGTD